MLTAMIDHSGVRKIAARTERSEGPFRCVVCRQEVILRKGLVRIHHFAHRAAAVCPYRGESLLHLRIKEQIYRRLTQQLKEKVKKIELEVPLGPVRPDVFIEGRKRQIAIEIQASPIAPKELLQRTHHYNQMGIFVLWVLPFKIDRFTEAESRPEQAQFKHVRLREYERVLAAMSQGQLVLWDESDRYGQDFIVLKTGATFTAGSAYYSYEWSALIEFDPKPKKMIKAVTQAAFNVALGDFRPWIIQKNKMPGASFYLPPRRLMLYGKG